VILANTSANKKGEWDERNKKARAHLVAEGVDIQHRMFNNNTHIGHNKFVVHTPPGGSPMSVLTGSTIWTSTGVAGQTKELAEAYAVHILDVYDHYRFRAIEAERKRQGKSKWSGFLETDDSWQQGYVEHRKGAIMRYFAR
jgi:hypothetical protein